MARARNDRNLVVIQVSILDSGSNGLKEYSLSRCKCEATVPVYIYIFFFSVYILCKYIST